MHDCLTRWSLLFSLFIYFVTPLYSEDAPIATQNATVKTHGDELVVEKFSTVLRKSFSHAGCNTLSSNCQACSQHPRCRYCVMKALGANRLLIEKGVTGRLQLVGKCVDVTAGHWNDPVPITEGGEHYSDGKDGDVVLDGIRYGECGLMAPDFERGFTCWDVETASEWVRYRGHVERMQASDIDTQAITDEARSSVEQEEEARLQQWNDEQGYLQQQDLLVATPDQQQGSTSQFGPHIEDSYQDALNPFDSILITLVVPVSLMLLVSITTALLTRLCGCRGCCCLCKCTIRFIRCFKRRFIYRQGVSPSKTSDPNASMYPMHPMHAGLTMTSTNPFDDYRFPKSPRCFRTASDLSTTAGSTWGIATTTFNRTADPFLSSTEHQNLNQTMNQLNDQQNRTLPVALYQLQIDRDFYDHPPTTTANLSIEQQPRRPFHYHNQNHLEVPRALVGQPTINQQHRNPRAGFIDEEQILREALNRDAFHQNRQQEMAQMYVQQESQDALPTITTRILK